MANSEKATVREYLASNGIGEVPVCGFGSFKLTGTDGNIYREMDGVRSNMWVMEKSGSPSVVYVGTSRHAGGVVLRPLFVLIDGVWRNTSTGKPAPDWALSE